MSMTNYMELLMTNRPYNLVLFMVIPVGLAEGLVATEFYTLYLKGSGFWRKLNKILGILAGLYFTGVFIYLMKMSSRISNGAVGLTLWRWELISAE